MRKTIYVLVVDDNPRDREVVAEGLEKAFGRLGLPVKILIATEARGAFGLLEKGADGEPVDLVAVDYQLTGWGRDGDTLAGEIALIFRKYLGLEPPWILAICGDPEDFSGVSIVSRDPLRFSSGQRVQAAVKKAQEADELTGYDFSKALTEALQRLLL